MSVEPYISILRTKQNRFFKKREEGHDEFSQQTLRRRRNQQGSHNNRSRARGNHLQAYDEDAQNQKSKSSDMKRKHLPEDEVERIHWENEEAKLGNMSVWSRYTALLGVKYNYWRVGPPAQWNRYFQSNK